MKLFKFSITIGLFHDALHYNPQHALQRNVRFHSLPSNNQLEASNLTLTHYTLTAFWLQFNQYKHTKIVEHVSVYLLRPFHEL